VSPGLQTVWDWEGMAKRGTNPVKNVPNPYSTTSVAKGRGKKRKSRKTKRKTMKRRK